MKLLKRVKSWFFAEEVRWKQGEMITWLSNNGYQRDPQVDHNPYTGDLEVVYNLFTDSRRLLMKAVAGSAGVSVFIPSSVYMPAVIEYQDDMGTVYRKVEEMAAIAKMNSL